MGFNSGFKGLNYRLRPTATVLDFELKGNFRGPYDTCGSGSVVGIATGYELDGPRIESRWGRDFPHRSRGPPSLLRNWYRVFPGGKERPGRDADPSPPSSAVVKKE